jgi:hypothetical protein
MNSGCEIARNFAEFGKISQSNRPGIPRVSQDSVYCSKNFVFRRKSKTTSVDTLTSSDLKRDPHIPPFCQQRHHVLVPAQFFITLLADAHTHRPVVTGLDSLRYTACMINIEGHFFTIITQTCKNRHREILKERHIHQTNSTFMFP